MNVFVTGGTGFVGREIVRELHEAGHNIRLLVRANPEALRMVEQYNVEIRIGDIFTPAPLPKAMQGMDAVIHLVGIISETETQTFENVHTRGTENVVNAALAAGVRRFIHMSALGTRVAAVSRYHKSKWAAEQIVNRSPTEWTIFRPSLIYGPHDHFVNLFASVGKWSPVIPVMADKKATFYPVAVEHVAKCFVRALDESRCIRQTLDICGPDRLTLEQIIRNVLTTMNEKSFLPHVPASLSMILAGFTEFIFRTFTKKAPPLNRDQVQMLQEDHPCDSKWTMDLFKIEPRRFAEGISYLKTGKST
jgi:uncharacterized protein YbjT (DUF2867 family)